LLFFNHNFNLSFNQTHQNSKQKHFLLKLFFFKPQPQQQSQYQTDPLLEKKLMGTSIIQLERGKYIFFSSFFFFFQIQS
jgi:hypothetical protein